MKHKQRIKGVPYKTSVERFSIRINTTPKHFA